jgi:hypothetical protein
MVCSLAWYPCLSGTPVRSASLSTDEEKVTDDPRGREGREGGEGGEAPFEVHLVLAEGWG